MVRNIPVRYTQDMLLKEWPNQGTYDFLYLPICIDRKRNASFCFINFVSEATAAGFQARWQKQRLEHFSARKPLDISAADVQGRDDNLLQIMRNKTFRIKNQYFQPAIFTGSERISMEDFLVSLNWQIKGLKLTKFRRDEQKQEDTPKVGQPEQDDHDNGVGSGLSDSPSAGGADAGDDDGDDVGIQIGASYLTPQVAAWPTSAVAV